jgi:hypothetical protein
MHESRKLSEARYFLDGMVAEQTDHNNFTFEMSAFLSAARSVLQYALEEAKSKPRGQQWYEGAVSASKVVKFFKDKRDINVHTEPVRPIAEHTLSVPVVSLVSSSLAVTVTNKDGDIIHQPHSEPPASAVSRPDSPAGDNMRYKIDGWLGSEDCLTLCRQYVSELATIVNDGIQKGYITT